ncbi:hypothetical protein BKA70DRAFT_1255296 [Coprinopsis sp. MPI-PUGE-AT-0042]|nr:hypothetical protein BKA70DRAFT_1255296 [Coprinopsis sp. MPI-PUGE-AT-0042]
MSPRSALQLLLFLVLSLQLSLGFASPTFHDHAVSTRTFATNAQRLAAGLPPLTPKRRFSPTRAQLAARGAPSPTPFSGFIRISDVNGQPTRDWLQRRKASLVGVERTAYVDDKLAVAFTFYSSDITFEIAIRDLNTDFPYLGLEGSTFGSNLNSITRTNSGMCKRSCATYFSYLPVMPLITVPSGSMAKAVGSSPPGITSESHVWKLNPTTNELTAVWINPDSKEVPVYFYIDTRISASGSPTMGSFLGYPRARLYFEAA